MRPPWAITSNRALRKHYHELQAGDLFLGMLNIKPSEEYLFADLLDRGIEAFPPLMAQYLSRSKCLQAQVYERYMPPLTFVARDRHDLIRAVNLYGEHGISAVITKQNRFNCGLGIHFWENFETLYSFVTLTNQSFLLGNLFYPFVVQPFIKDVTDVRVVILGDYIEAYSRKNPHNFRNNLYFGGEAREYPLSQEELALCQEVMKRGRFPYAHIDLMVTPEGKVYLSEINLRGGLKGAKISTEAYQAKIEAIHQEFLNRWLAEHPEAQIIS